MGTPFETAVGSGRAMTHYEKVFFKQLGVRIAALRKDQGMTQVQLAELLGLSQQMVASYEVGRRRAPVSLLPQIAQTLAVSLEELIGQKDLQPAKRGPAPKLQQQIERIQQLPRAKQRFVMEMIDTVLAQQSR
jgi:transcriptional regulator with XRE-family HTH domain